MRTYIYALIDPRTNRIRYIGKTNDLRTRLGHHIIDAKYTRKRHVCFWIRQLLHDGLEPIQKIIEECVGDGCDEEKYHIRLAHSDGIDLTNHTDGGEGITGFKYSAESRKKMSEAKKGCKPHPNLTAACSAYWKGRKHTAEHSEKIASQKRGVPRTQDVKHKISAALLGRARPQVAIEGQKRFWAKFENRLAESKKQRKMSDSQIKEILSLYRAGEKTHIIMSIFDISSSTLYATLNLYGVSRRCRRHVIRGVKSAGG